MKIVFMGTPDFSVAALESIYNAGHEIAAVVTQPDKKKGRGEKIQFPPVKEKALELGLKVYQPVKARDEEFINILREINPDVMVVIAFGQILPKEILEISKYGCINVHASLLPKYRGAAPIQWAVIDGEEVTGVTTMQMDVGVDTGDILEVTKVVLDKKETGGSLFEKLSVEGAKLIVQTLENAEKGLLNPIKQNNDEATHAKMLNKELGNIDFTKPAVEIERLIRGLNPWPSAYTRFRGKTLKIWDANVVDTENEDGKNIDENYADEKCENKHGKPGEIIDFNKTGFTVKTGKGNLIINELQLEGKKRMKAEAFLAGNKLEKGEMLG